MVLFAILFGVIIYSVKILIGKNSPVPKLQWLPLIIFAFIIQVLFILPAPWGLFQSSAAAKILLLSSLILLLIACLKNIRNLGIMAVTAGLILNLLAVSANGGLMPVTPDAVDQAGGHGHPYSEGTHVPRTKSIILSKEDTRLQFLTDVYVVPHWMVIPGPYSIGDFFIVAGVFLVLAWPVRLRRGGFGFHERLNLTTTEPGGNA